VEKKLWLTAFGAMAAVDLYCAKVRHGGTLSQAGREIFRTNTPAGRAAWIAGWTGLTAWLIPHIIKWPEQIENIIDELS
jgi:hypothetical protein